MEYLPFPANHLCAPLPDASRDFYHLCRRALEFWKGSRDMEDSTDEWIQDKVTECKPFALNPLVHANRVYVTHSFISPLLVMADVVPAVLDRIIERITQPEDLELLDDEDLDAALFADGDRSFALWVFEDNALTHLLPIRPNLLGEMMLTFSSENFVAKDAYRYLWTKKELPPESPLAARP